MTKSKVVFWAVGIPLFIVGSVSVSALMYSLGAGQGGAIIANMVYGFIVGVVGFEVYDEWVD